jgi:hypothetical protein
MIAAVPRTKPRATKPTTHACSPKLRFTEIEFCAWVAQADAGDRLEYYRGYLVADTLAPLSPLTVSERAALRSLADGAYRAAEQDLVHLVQHRHGPDDYSYLAIARPKPKRAQPSLTALLADADAA